MSCLNTYYRPIKFPTIEERVEEVITWTKNNLNLDLLPYKANMLIGNPDKFSFTYFGPGQFKLTSHAVQGEKLILPTLNGEIKNKYNCVIEYAYWEQEKQSLYFLTDEALK